MAEMYFGDISLHIGWRNGTHYLSVTVPVEICQVSGWVHCAHKSCRCVYTVLHFKYSGNVEFLRVPTHGLFWLAYLFRHDSYPSVRDIDFNRIYIYIYSSQHSHTREYGTSDMH
jgi:hypothetical protein